MSKGEVGILNVGAGDTKLSFDKSNPAECIRAGRIVTDMLRRGYALLIEVDGKTKRVKKFDPETSEYIIADFDPLAGAKVDATEAVNVQGESSEPEQRAPAEAVPEERNRQKAKARERKVSAADVSGVAVARTAGG